MQVGHQLGVVRDVLPRFIDEEVQAKTFAFTVDILFDLIGEVFDRKFVVGAKPIHDVFDRLPRGRGIGGINRCGHTGDSNTPPFPAFGLLVGKCGFEFVKQSVFVQLTFEVGDIRLLAVVATVFIENFNEHR